MNNDSKLRTAIDTMHQSNMRVDGLNAQLEAAVQAAVDAKSQVVRVLGGLGLRDVDVIYSGRVYRSHGHPAGLDVNDFTGRILSDETKADGSTEPEGADR